MSYYTESRSAGAFIPEEMHPQYILHWILIRWSLYSRGNTSKGYHITLDPNQQELLLQNKQQTDPQDVI